MPIHSFDLSNDEEKQFQAILSEEKDRSKSAIIRDRIFRRRDRNHLKIEVIDLTFLSTLSNMISSMQDANRRGEDLANEFEELKNLVNQKLENA